MLQRVQSIFLLLSASFAAATWFFPVRSWAMEEGTTIFMTRGLFDHNGLELDNASLPAPYHVLQSVVAGALLVCIFLFSNRPRQARVVRGVWLVALLVGVFQFISCNSIDAYLREGLKSEGSYGISFFLPLGTIIFAILAERAIRKDENLVRSADRLR